MPTDRRRASLIAFSAILGTAIAGVHGDARAQDRKIWDNWYTITVNGTKYAYYNDKVSLKKGRLYFQSNTWKRKSGSQVREMTAGFSLNDTKVTPLYFKYMYRAPEENRQASARVRGRKKLQGRVVKNGDKESVSASLPEDAVLGSFFPVWLGRNMSEIQSGRTLSFNAILENEIAGADTDKGIIAGSVRKMDPDSYTSSTRTEKLEVRYGDVLSHWYVRGSGLPVRIMLPEQNTVVQLVSSSQARGFLD